MGCFLKIFFVLILSFLFFSGTPSFARNGPQCSSLFFDYELDVKSVEKTKQNPSFENGHNVPLRNVMLKMKEYEGAIQEFVQGLVPRVQSKYLKDNSQQYRNPEVLKEVIEIAEKYEKVLEHLVEHSDHLMMSPRIQMIPLDKRAEFIQKYKQAYVDYLDTYKMLVQELKLLQKIDPNDWDTKAAGDILMQLHAQMGAAHNKF